MAEPLVTSPPVIMAPRADGCEIVWGVSRLSRGWLQWSGPSGGGVARADSFGMVPQGDRVLRVRLRGLAAGSEVMVRVITESVVEPAERQESEWKRVHTLDPAAPTAQLAVWNDTHQRADTLRALDQLTPEVDMLVWNGDLCNDWKDPSSFTSTVLNPDGLDISRGRPLAIAIGNHDVRGRWAYRLQEYVATPEGRPYSACRIGPVACILLHTGEDKPDDHPTFEGRVAFEQLRAEQAAWLREVTARPEIRDAPYRLVFCHIPLRWIDETPPDYEAEGYDWFSGSSREAWHDALVSWGAQLIISGHTHFPALIEPAGGFPYGQIIGGGPDSDPASPEAATWIEVTADESELVATVRDLGGAVIHRRQLRPLQIG